MYSFRILFAFYHNYLYMSRADACVECATFSYFNDKMILVVLFEQYSPS